MLDTELSKALRTTKRHLSRLELMGLKTNSWELEAAIHSGEGLYAFYPKVWMGIPNRDLDFLHKSKQLFF